MPLFRRTRRSGVLATAGGLPFLLPNRKSDVAYEFVGDRWSWWSVIGGRLSVVGGWQSAVGSRRSVDGSWVDMNAHAWLPILDSNVWTLTHEHTRAHTHARTHACTHARTHAQSHT